MKQILHLTLFLAIVSALAGGALAFANQMTAPVIQANNERAEKQVLLEMYPDANVDEFEIMDVTTDNPSINKIYSFENNYIFNMSVSGYKDGRHSLFAGIDNNELKCTAFKAIPTATRKALVTRSWNRRSQKALSQRRQAWSDRHDFGRDRDSQTPSRDGIHQQPILRLDRIGGLSNRFENFKAV